MNRPISEHLNLDTTVIEREWKPWAELRFDGERHVFKKSLKNVKHFKYFFNHTNPSTLFVGKAFEENSNSTSLQRAAAIFCKSLPYNNIKHKIHQHRALRDSAQPYGV